MPGGLSEGMGWRSGGVSEASPLDSGRHACVHMHTHIPAVSNGLRLPTHVGKEGGFMEKAGGVH